MGVEHVIGIFYFNVLVADLVSRSLLVHDLELNGACLSLVLFSLPSVLNGCIVSQDQILDYSV